MSADNGYIIRKNDAERFVLQMYFQSNDEYPPINRENAVIFDTLEKAIDHYNQNHAFDSEYGLSIQIDQITPNPAPEQVTEIQNEDSNAMLEISEYARNPFHVLAVQVTEDNMDEVATWCGGKVVTNTDVKHIKVDVKRALNAEQTKATPGKFVLKAGSGFKVYTESAFHDGFTKVANDVAGTPPTVGVTPEARDTTQDAEPVEVGPDNPPTSDSFSVDDSHAQG